WRGCASGFPSSPRRVTEVRRDGRARAGSAAARAPGVAAARAGVAALPADSLLPLRDRPGAAEGLPLPPVVLGLRARGVRAARALQRLLPDGAPHRPLPSVQPGRVRPGA